MHEVFKWIGFAVPIAVLIWLMISMRQLTKGFKPFERSTFPDFDDIRSRAELQLIEQKEFQQELLTELRRHNAALERQAEMLAQVLERQA